MNKSPSSFFALTRDYLSFYLPHHSSEHTVDAYTDALTVFRRYVSDEKGIKIKQFTFDDCTFDFVLDYRTWLVDTAECTTSTANHRLAVLKAYIRYASSRYVELIQVRLIVDEVPFLKTPHKIRPVIEDLDILTAFLDSPPNTHLGRRDRTMLAILFDTAMRAEELTKLRLQDVCLNSDIPHVLIQGKGDKEREVPLCEKSVKLLQSYFEEFHAQPCGGDFVFFATLKGVPHQMTVRNVERIVRKYGDQLRRQFPDFEVDIHPHMLRRTRGTLLYQNGIAIEMVSKLLGHANIQTTLDHYVKPSLIQKEEALKKCNAGGIIGVQAIQEWPDDDEEFARACGLR